MDVSKLKKADKEWVDQVETAANFLDPKHVGWKEVGYMWDDKKAKHAKEVDSFFEI